MAESAGAVPLAGNILIADDEEPTRKSLAELLREEGFQVSTVGNGAEAIAEIDKQSFDVVVTDLRMPEVDGLGVLGHVRRVAPQTFVLLITAFASIDTAVEALRLGAHDYILKPIIVDDVIARIRRILEYRQTHWEVQQLRREVGARFDFESMIVERNPAMLRMREIIRKVAPTNSTVLVTGESGTGKEVVARALHSTSHLKEKLFLPVNCAAIPENLLESQLFGHIKGAFTGAVGAQEGLFQRARGGTIFLDEIGDMPISLQVKLLRAIEQKEILPLGTTTPIKIDIRIIAATNRDLRKAVDEGKFREDLFYRLNVVGLDLPPLRERREDIPALVEYLVRRHNTEMKKGYRGVDNATMRVLVALPWKGNIRELDNVIEHAMILGDGEWITIADLPRSVPVAALDTPDAGDDLRNAMKVYEKSHIESVLRRTNNDKRQAAELLGLSLSSLYRKIEELEIAEAT